MRKIWTGLLSIVAFGVGLGACKKVTGPQMIVFTSADNPPFEFHDTGAETITGFDIELITRIGEKLGMTVVIHDVDFNGLVSSLQSGRADAAVAAITPTPERLMALDFSDIYYMSQDALISRVDQKIDHTVPLGGKSIGVQIGTTQELIVHELAADLKSQAIRNVPAMAENGLQLTGQHSTSSEGEHPADLKVESRGRYADLIQELKNGRVDAIVVEASAGQNFAAGDPTLHIVPFTSPKPHGYAIAFPKGSPLKDKVNYVLQEMHQKGEIDALRQKWLKSTSR